ncbi:MAG: lipopolysaccharide transport periplasmic protein LptA [Gammaproteobacteria bacterium]|jgi:lipopolysaccharide transport protein LptA|nr:lipopolysaccharide transport periplasmic protein LptA [Gammaproteobacteria bacterium]
MFRTHASYPLHVIASILTIGMLSFGSPGSVAREEQSSAQSGDITLDAASSEVDYRANALLFRDIIITQGKVRVVAQRARSTGLDFDDSTWTLSGAVRIDVDGGTLTSDEAAVTFEKNRIVSASIRGKPAEFSQQLKDGGRARGRAGSILYDMTASTVTLREEAWLSDNGRSEIRGDQLVYNVREQRVQAGKPAGSEERVRIIIRPRSTP